MTTMNTTTAIVADTPTASDWPNAIPTSSFIRPRKMLLTKEQLEIFPSTRTYIAIIDYIEALNTAARGVKLSDACAQSPVSVSLAVCARALEREQPLLCN